MFTESLLCDPPAREAPAGPHQSLVQRLCPGVPQQGHPARLPPGPGDSGQSGAAKGRTGEGPAGHSHKDWRAGPGLPRVGDDLQARAQGPVPRARAGRHPHSTQAPAGPTGDSPNDPGIGTRTNQETHVPSASDLWSHAPSFSLFGERVCVFKGRPCLLRTFSGSDVQRQLL